MSSDNWLLFVGTITYTFFFCLFNYGQIKWSSKDFVYSSNSKKLQGPKSFFWTKSPQPVLCLDYVSAVVVPFLFFVPQVTQAGIDCVYAVMSFCNKNGHMSLFIRFLECQNHVCSLFPSKQSQDNGERILVLGLWDIFFF